MDGMIWAVEHRRRGDPWEFNTAETTRKQARELAGILRQMDPGCQIRVVPYYRGEIDALRARQRVPRKSEAETAATVPASDR